MLRVIEKGMISILKENEKLKKKKKKQSEIKQNR